ncbi:MAG: alpha/beta fold hydrolase [Rhodospirillaceae bacterium]|nr:alpha/beta fold hydrolase [Rhodospirillaceae bacterium]
MKADFKESFVEADGFRIRFMAAGPASGDAVICLHGAGGLRVSKFHELLAENYQVFVFEAPGFGESAVNERSQTMWDLAGTMNQAVSALDTGPLSLIGNSFGGKLALCMAALKPEFVINSMMLIAPAAIRPDPELRFSPAERQATMYAHPERQSPRPPLSDAVAKKQQTLFRRLIGQPRNADLEMKMAEINAPVLALFGVSDRLIPSDMARHYVEILPNCHVTMVYDAAHVIDADRPEATFSIAADFLENREKFLVTGADSLLHP